MSTSNQATDAPERARTSGIYVYGIVPADVERRRMRSVSMTAR